MKRIIAGLLAAVMTLSTVVIGAGAENRTNAINESLADKSEIHVLVNDSIVPCEVKPLNADGRVMIPFRSALEALGASIDYDETLRRVTASKDGITISFTLMDDTIYITNGTSSYTITMDTPMMIVDDRTLVPIRFMSNAFDLQIGWDGNTGTVVIVDFSKFMSEFQRRCPNLYKLSQLDVNTFFNKADVKLDMDASMMGQSMFAANMNASSAFNNETASADVNFGVQSQMFSLDDSNISMVFNGETIYIKTNVFDNLAKSVPSAAEAAAKIDSGTWYSVNIVELIKALKLDEEFSKWLKAILELQGNTDIDALLRAMLSTEGDAVLADVLIFSKLLDMLEAIDKYITVTETGSGYIVTIDISAEEFEEIFSAAFGSLVSEDALQSAFGSMNMSLNARIENTGDTLTATIKFVMDSSYMTMTMNAEENAEYNPNVQTLPVPESSVDLTGILADAFGKLRTGVYN